MTALRFILDKFGVDKSVFYYLLSGVFPFIASPVTIFLIAAYFSPSEQGYYYTFSSLLGLSVFFELGLGIVITQFASHEYARLSWNENGGLSGDTDSLSRIISLLRKSLKWYAFIAVGCLILLIPVGLSIFGSKPDSRVVSYTLQWILLVTFFGLGTWTIPLTSITEGCGCVKEMQKLRAVKSAAGIVCGWGVILMGGKLFSISFQFIVYSCVVIGWFVCNHKGLLLQILRRNSGGDKQILWFKEIFPMQWKIAVSSMSAYFTGCLFVPLLFVYSGPVEAGKMGMTLKISRIVYTFSMAWIGTRVPYYGALAHKREYRKLEGLAVKSGFQAGLAALVISVFVMTALSIVEWYIPQYNNRVLSKFIVAVLCVASLINVINSAVAGYLRAFRQEPLMWVFVITAVCVIGASFISARYYDAGVMAVLYAVIMGFVALPGCWLTLIRKRRDWHIAPLTSRSI